MRSDSAWNAGDEEWNRRWDEYRQESREMRAEFQERDRVTDRRIGDLVSAIAHLSSAWTNRTADPARYRAPQAKGPRPPDRLLPPPKRVPAR
jgi:hypothetical protein